MGDGVRVGHFEAAFLQVVAEIEDGAADEEGALGIDDDPDFLGLDHDVAIRRAIDQVHFVLQARAAPSDDRNAKGALLAALFAQEGGETRAGLLGEFYELFVANLVVDRGGWCHGRKVEGVAGQVNSARAGSGGEEWECWE